MEPFLHLKDSGGQGNEKLKAFSYTSFLLGLAFLSLKGYEMHFKGNVATLFQVNNDSWSLTSVSVGRSSVITLENVGGFSLLPHL